MTDRIRDYVMRRFGLSENGWNLLKRSTVSALMTDIAVMLPMLTAIMLIGDLVDGGGAYIDTWVYVVMGVLSIVIVWLTYRKQYDRCFADTYQVSKHVRINMAERMRKLPLSFITGRDSTDLTGRIMGDVTMQEELMSHWLPSLMASLVFTPVAGVVMILWSPWLGIAMAWPIPISVSIAIYASGIINTSNRRKMEKTAHMIELMDEIMNCSMDLNSNRAMGRHLDAFDRELDAVEGAEIKAELTVAFTISSAQMILRLGMVTTAIIGVCLFVDDSIPLMMLITALVASSAMYGPIDTALMNLATATVSEQSCHRVSEMFEAGLQEGSTEFSPSNHDLVFDKVCFSYTDGKQILRDVSFTAKEGEVTAIVGPSGSGKSTISRLCTRFWDADSGTVSLGGVNISTVDPETLMREYSVVFQDVVLFDTSIMENIRMGRLDATDEEVMQAAHSTKCDEFVSRLPEGYSSKIGENGDRLSGGERQRISIARALLKDAPIIIMDEATSSLDAESESFVQEALSELVTGKTVIIIAHRMRTILDADKVVVISDGRVIESGKPSELLASGGVFADVVHTQTGTDSWSLLNTS